MKNTNILIALLTGSAFVTVPLAQPESDIAIPAEKTEITQGAPNLEQKQKEDWQRLREERKLARQQILSDIKANAKAEIKNIQEDVLQQKLNNNKNENRGNQQNRGLLQKASKEQNRNGIGIGNSERPRSPILPHENTPPIEHIPFPRNN